MKRVKNIKKLVGFLCPLCSILVMSCVDVLDIQQITNSEGNGILVVEAILTDEVKNQVVYLSRSDSRTDLERDTTYIPFITPGLRPRDTVNVETDATVRLLADDGSVFSFIETKDGLYQSDQVFALQMDSKYQLELKLANGNEYISKTVQIEGKSSIERVYAERAISETGEDGVAVYVDSNPLEGKTENYRYNYVETYKVIAPLWVSREFKLTNYTLCPESDYTLEVVPREVQNRVCYNTVDSNTVIQTNTLNNTTNNVERFMVRFISRDDFIISHRYSVLVKQMVQSLESYAFYETLRKFSGAESLFSQIQPGELLANISRKDRMEESILGWVEAVSISEKRLFFDFEDFFAGEELPEYPFNCNLLSVPVQTLFCNELGGITSSDCPLGIVEGVDGNFYSFYDYYTPELVPISVCPGPYAVTPAICGDCRLLGSNIEPEFWTEE